MADGKAERKPAVADEAPISKSAPKPSAPKAPEPPAEPAFLPENAVLEEPSPMRVEPAPSAADEDMVLSDSDFVREGDAGPASRGDDGFVAGEIERESSYSYSDRQGGEVSSDARRITVPIDLGKFPPSGKLKVTFEVRIELEEEPKSGSKRSKKSADPYSDYERTR